MSDALALARAAESLVGTPFRLRGRDRQSGLDCIGLVSMALGMAGREVPSLPRYTLRNLDVARFARLVSAIGLVEAPGPSAAGDIALLRPSAAQYHLAIVGFSGSMIHAHAGLRKVVASPPPLPWRAETRWRLLPN